MAGKGKSPEQIKKIAALVVTAVFVLVLVYQLFFSAPTPRPTLGSRNANAAPEARPVVPSSQASAPAAPPRVTPSGTQDALLLALLSDSTPLNIAVLSHSAGNSKPGARGNIFGYYVKPPEPPPPPPPPPPIVLTGLSPQSAIASAPQKVTLTVTGNKIPPDARVYYGGTPKPTKRLSDSQLSIELEPGEYGAPGSFNVEVKSAADPGKMNSNIIQFVAQPPPEPGVVFKARLGPLGQPQLSYAVFEVQSTKEIKRLRRGETLQAVWRIDAINADSVDVTHTQYEIKRRIMLQEKPK
ncbi:MAG: IPT/TIG domain-containing protein [Blastocatellia bacterium]